MNTTTDTPHGWAICAAKAFIFLHTKKTKCIYKRKSSNDYLHLIEHAFGFCSIEALLYAADELGYTYEADTINPEVYYFDFKPRNLWKQ